MDPCAMHDGWGAAAMAIQEDPDRGRCGCFPQVAALHKIYDLAYWPWLGLLFGMQHGSL